MKRKLLGMAMAIAAAGCAVAVQAQEYPTRPVRLMIGNPPGGPSDLSLRGIAGILSKSLGQPFVVENRTGADGRITGEACAKAPPDGHTLCMADSFNLALNPAIHPNMTYSPSKDLAPVIHTGFLPSGFWLHKSIPANSLSELLALARRKPGTINWASFGRASSGGIYVSWLKNVKGVEFTEIPYKSAVDAFKAVMQGESHIAIYGLRSGMAQMDSGNFKLLAVNTAQRFPDLPQVPTFREGGIEEVMITWFGILAPAGTPKAIINRLNAEIAKGLFKTPENRETFLNKQGLLVYGPAGGSPEAFGDFIKTETEMYARLVKLAKIKVE